MMQNCTYGIYKFYSCASALILLAEEKATTVAEAAHYFQLAVAADERLLKKT
eukprot:Awhi_evm1s7153